MEINLGLFFFFWFTFLERFFSYYVDWHSDVNFFFLSSPRPHSASLCVPFFILVAVFFSLFFEFLFIGKFQPSDVSPVMGSLCHANKQKNQHDHTEFQNKITLFLQSCLISLHFWVVLIVETLESTGLPFLLGSILSLIKKRKTEMNADKIQQNL